MSRFVSPRRGIVASAIFGLVAAPLAVTAAAPAQAAPSTGLVISEVYGGGGNTGATFSNDFIELYNPTGAAISVAGMSVQYRSATGNTAALTNLTGSVAAGGHYLIQEAAGTTVTDKPLPTPDATGTLAMSGTNGVVILANNQVGVTAVGNFATNPPANVVDTVGYGTTPTTFETANTGVALTNSTSAQRTGADTDANAADFDELAPVPQNSNAAPAGFAATNPGNRTATTGQAITPFTLAATGGTAPYSWTATGLPAGVTIAANGTVSGTPTAAGVSNVVATATDSATPTAGTAQTSFTITVTDAGAALTIADIQGTGDATPFANQAVTTTGVVTASFPTGGLGGFYLQTGGADTTPNASDGIFAYAPSVTAGSYPAVGDTVTVSGTAKEFTIGSTSLTEIEIANASAITSAAAQPAVVAKTVIPGTDCIQGSCLAAAGLLTAREKVEGELFAPTGSYTTTDVYDGSPFPSTSSGNFGEIGLAAESTKALLQPTELYDAQNEKPAIAALTAFNDAHRIILDDGSSLNYSTPANTGLPLPWVTNGHYTRNNAPVTFPKPVVLTVGFDGATLLPSTGQVIGDSTGSVNFAQNRPAAPGAVGGDIKLATFNVLNYFPTTGEEFVALGGGRTCTYYSDRAGNRITNNTCNPDGPRGAANAANLQRQQDKIVNAINGLGASIVSLEEIENSAKYGKNRDFAVNTLVTALNASAGAGTWAAAPSPSAADLPTLAQEDVIRTAFIYKPAQVSLVGASKVLNTQSSAGGAFENAREPLAQGFKGVGQADAKAFAVIVNHFKSKGSGNADPDGQGNANDQRVAQANALKTFATSFSNTLGGSGAVFLTGDFNAYTMEDPVQVLTSGGYTQLESTTAPGEESYNFSGLDGSLDHVFANATANAMVTGVDIWNINGDESVYREYSRFNYNATDLYTTTPFRASDHNPEIIGINLGQVVDPAPVDVQILATNDFHGRIAADPSSSAAGAAVLAGAVKQLRAANPNTTFAAAGDLIGASTFESFIANDKPTIDALNEAGLDVSSVGNHEFDQGYDDLVNRVIKPYDAQTNPDGGAEWKYIGANVKFKDSGNPALDPTFMVTQSGVTTGYIGAVTEHLPELVSPDGIANITVTDIVAATNTAANDLKAEGADVIVLLVHEGAPTTDCTAISNLGADTDFGSIVKGVNDKVDAIVSGHTHLEYNCSFPVAGWAGRPVTERPVVSAGQYGTNLNKLVFTVNPTTGVVQAKTQALLKLKAANAGPNNYPVDAPTQAIVDAAVANANVLGAQPLGKIAAPFYRAKLANGTTENRGGESTLGNLVAEIQQDATEDATFGGAQIAFMNPGGLRTDLVGNPDGTVTFKQAANVQPFANTLVNEDLTGAQIKAALEQQWQPATASRPFLKLGISEGFTYTYDFDAAQGERIQEMYLDGVAIDPTATYSVTVNSFLAAGGDNFPALNGAARKQDTGRTDLQAQVDYFAEFASDAPLPVDFSQRAVGVDIPADAPATYDAGSDVTFDLSSLSMTGRAAAAPAAGDLTDANVEVSLDGASLGSFPVTTTLPEALPGFDEVGTASVDVTIPADAVTGDYELLITGSDTGTEVVVPISVKGAQAPDPVASTITASAVPAKVVVLTGTGVSISVTADGVTPTGDVELSLRGQVLNTRALSNGTVFIPTGRLTRTGVYTLMVSYLGDDAVKASSTTVSVKVVKQTPNLIVKAPKKVTKGARPTVQASLVGINATVTGKVIFKYAGKKVVKVLKNGKTSVRLAKLKKTTTVRVIYKGDGKLFTQQSKRTTIKVGRK